MNTDRRRALVALTIAGLLWGSTVPLSKIALTWLPPGWLTAWVGGEIMTPSFEPAVPPFALVGAARVAR